MLKTNYLSILKIAIPMMLGMFIQSIVMITDGRILSDYNIDSYNAVGNAGLIYVTLFMGMNGLGDAAQILMSNRLGEGSTEKIKRIIPTAIISNLILALVFFCVIQLFVEPMLSSYSRNLDLVAEQSKFLDYRSLGFFFVAISLTLNGYFLAIGKTGYILISALIFALTNISFDIMLVYGVEGVFPEMGIEGAAIASVLGEVVSLLFLIFVFITHKKRQELQLDKFLKPLKENFIKLWKTGTPLLLQGFLALATWTVFFTWIEQRSDFELTVSQNIRYIYMLAFIPIFGYSATTKTYVSNLMGSQNFKEIKVVLRKIIILSILTLLITFHGAILYPKTVITVVNDNVAFLDKSADILFMVFFSLVLYAIISPIFNAVSATGNTRVSLIIEISSILCYLIFAYLFLKVLQLDIFYVWFVEYIYFGVIGILTIAYFKFYNWQKKRI